MKIDFKLFIARDLTILANFYLQFPLKKNLFFWNFYFALIIYRYE